MTSEAGILDFNGGQIAYEVAGGGAPIVFIHGFSLDMRMWDPQFEHFSRTHRVVRYDLRGFGRSSVPAAAYDHCDDLVALLDRLGIERPLLVGLSLGANIALRFAADWPDRVAGIVLASPGLPGHVWSEERPPDAARALGKKEGVESARRFWTGHALFASLDRYPEARRAAHAMLADYSGWHWHADDMQAAAPAIIDRLESIAAPARVLSGDHDVAGYRDIARVIASRLPDARLVAFPEGGHMLTMELPHEVNAEIARFGAPLTVHP